MSSKGKELLDVITAKAECDYLSDINLPENKERVMSAVRTIKAEDYDLPQWLSAVKYMRGSDVTAKTPKEARELLLDMSC